MTAASASDGPVSFDVDIREGRTTISVTGSSEVAVVVRSASGERVSLPPERDERTGESTPYEPAGNRNSPYEGISADTPYSGIPDESPYGSARQSPDTEGLTRTANGLRIVHPEPVTDVRILR